MLECGRNVFIMWQRRNSKNMPYTWELYLNNQWTFGMVTLAIAVCKLAIGLLRSFEITRENRFVAVACKFPMPKWQRRHFQAERLKRKSTLAVFHAKFSGKVESCWACLLVFGRARFSKAVHVTSEGKWNLKQSKPPVNCWPKGMEFLLEKWDLYWGVRLLMWTRDQAHLGTLLVCGGRVLISTASTAFILQRSLRCV